MHREITTKRVRMKANTFGCVPSRFLLSSHQRSCCGDLICFSWNVQYRSINFIFDIEDIRFILKVHPVTLSNRLHSKSRNVRRFRDQKIAGPNGKCLLHHTPGSCIHALGLPTKSKSRNVKNSRSTSVRFAYVLARDKLRIVLSVRQKRS